MDRRSSGAFWYPWDLLEALKSPATGFEYCLFLACAQAIPQISHALSSTRIDVVLE